MFIYNVTVNIDSDSAAFFERWMKESHIADVMETGCFREVRMSVLRDPVESQGTTYSFQYVVQDREAFERYEEEFADALRKDTKARFEGKFVAFRTFSEILMEEQMY